MSWHTGRLCAFDIESTGVDTETARIVTATVVHIQGAQIEARHWLINPGVEIPQDAIDVHGVTNERAQAEGVDPADAVREIHAKIAAAWGMGWPLIVYNAPYDITLLDREMRRHLGYGLPELGPIIDPFVIDKALDRYRRGKRTLTATCEHYGVRLDGAHDATEDALAAARLAWRLAQVYPDELGDLTLVNDLQARWRADWAASFQDYLRKQGKDESVDAHWPLRPLPVAS